MSGFSFGALNTPATATPANSTFGFPTLKTTGQSIMPTFGVATTSSGFGNLASFGVPAATTNTVPAFGTTPTPTFNFGLPTTTPISNTVTSSGFTFGNPATSTTTPTFNFPTPAPATTLGVQQATVPPTFSGFGGTSFSFNKPTTTMTSATFNYGTTTTTSLGTSMFGKVTTTTSTAAATPFIGLGGIDISCTQPKAGDAKQDYIKIKETQVPDEIARTVEALKANIKTQKSFASDIGRTSTIKLTSVSGEINSLRWTLQEISNSVEANSKQIKLLRKETAKTIQSLEMAQRTQDTPVGLQFENNAPFQFFQNLVTKYEQDLVTFRQQIELTERHMQSLTNPQNVAPDDIKRGFRQINESFISLAGRLHELHQNVELQKEQYLNLRKYRLRDPTNVFAKLDNPDIKENSAHISTGPTPFSNITAISNFGKTFRSSNTSAVAETITTITQTGK